MSNPKFEQQMIMIRGLSPKFDLGVDWGVSDFEGEKIMLASAVGKEISVLGNMPLTMDNLERIRNFQWVYLVKREGEKWIPQELDWLTIPRPLPEINDIINVLISEEGGSGDGLEF